MKTAVIEQNMKIEGVAFESRRFWSILVSNSNTKIRAHVENVQLFPFIIFIVNQTVNVYVNVEND